uniref:Uncharacterized protein n=1 Tax=Panagrolaimus sp. ES5 TaxID=591445 RepID=A0AC34GE23_9BILA
IAALACLFLRPFCGAQRILEFLEKKKIVNSVDTVSEVNHAEQPPFNAEELRELEKAKLKKSAPPEKLSN